MVSFFQKGRGKSVFCLLSVRLSWWKIEDFRSDIEDIYQNISMTYRHQQPPLPHRRGGCLGYDSNVQQAIIACQGKDFLLPQPSRRYQLPPLCYSLYKSSQSRIEVQYKLFSSS